MGRTMFHVKQFLWIVVCIVCFTACGGVPQPTLTAAAIPAGWQPLAQTGFSLAMPPTWEVLSPEDADLSGGLAAAAQANAPLGEALSQAQASLAAGQLRVVAYDLNPDAETDALTNFSVGVLPAEGATLAQLRTANLAQLRGMAQVADIADQAAVVGGLPAAQWRYTLQVNAADGVASPRAIVQYLVVQRTEQYLLTFSSTPSSTTTLAPVFQQVVDTLRFTE